MSPLGDSVLEFPVSPRYYLLFFAFSKLFLIWQFLMYCFTLTALFTGVSGQKSSTDFFNQSPLFWFCSYDQISVKSVLKQTKQNTLLYHVKSYLIVVRYCFICNNISVLGDNQNAYCICSIEFLKSF